MVGGCVRHLASMDDCISLGHEGFSQERFSDLCAGIGGVDRVPACKEGRPDTLAIADGDSVSVGLFFIFIF